MTVAAPLAGRRIVLTRGAEKGGDLADLLAATGAELLSVPMIETESLQGAGSVRRALEAMALGSAGTSAVGWVVFTSATAVRLACDAAGDRLAGLRLAAVGGVTADALRSRGLAVDLVPSEATAEALAAALETDLGDTAAGARVLVLGADGGRDVVAPALRLAGAEVDLLLLYRSVLPPGAAAAFRAAMSPVPDAVVFSSGSAVRHASIALDGMAPPASAAAVCIGSTTAGAARAAGWAEVLMAGEATAAAIVDTVVARLHTDHPVP